MKPYIQALVVASTCSLLGGCALGNAIMAGYTPPQTIADLLREQDELTGLDDVNEPPILPNGEKLTGVAAMYRPDSRDKAMFDENGKVLSDSINNNAPQKQMHYALSTTRFTPSHTHKSLQDYAGQLAMDLMKNSAGVKRTDLIGIASFVDLDKYLQTSSILGNQLAEYFISEVQQFGLSVADYKMSSTINVTSRGDLVFSRDAAELAKNMQMDHVLSGTLITKSAGIQVNARLVSLSNNRVISTASVVVPHFVADSLRPNYVESLGY